jgi:RNA 3'-terminal phosphate cyclase
MSIINEMTVAQLEERVRLNALRGIASSQNLRDEIAKRRTVFIPSNVVVDAVEALLDVATARHSNGDETFIECKVCGAWEDHTAECFVPAIEKWQRA